MKLFARFSLYLSLFIKAGRKEKKGKEKGRLVKGGGGNIEGREAGS